MIGKLYSNLKENIKKPYIIILTFLGLITLGILLGITFSGKRKKIDDNIWIKPQDNITVTPQEKQKSEEDINKFLNNKDSNIPSDIAQPGIDRYVLTNMPSILLSFGYMITFSLLLFYLYYYLTIKYPEWFNWLWGKTK